MADPLSPPPSVRTLDSFDRWMLHLYRRLSGALQLGWGSVDTTGSNLTDLETRNHNDTQNRQGGSATESYHFTAAQHTDLTDAGDSALHFHQADRDYADGAVSTHAGEADPHTGYQKESEKDAANGYPGLDANVRLLLARLPLADADGKFLVRRAGATAYDTLGDADIPAAITRDSEVQSIVAALMLNGEMYSFNSATAISIAGANTWTAISSGFSAGDNDGVTFQNNSELKIVTASKYLAQWQLALDAAAANLEIEAGLMINGTIQEKTVTHMFFATANDTGNMKSQGMLTLAADDIVTLAVNNNTDASDLTMQHANVLLTRWLG